MQLSQKEKNRLKRKYGSWALITGATSGIGRELAMQLASAGFNLIINARQQNNLQLLSDCLQKEYSIKVNTVTGDISTPETIDSIIDCAKNIDTGLIALCAGYGSSGVFIDTSLHNEVNMLRVNCEAVLMLTHYFSQRFAQQKRGGIILMSSLVAFQGVPYSAHYAATKAYIQSLAEALACELKPYSVDVLAVAPGPVDSGFAQRANMKMSMSLKPEQLGAPVLKALGRKTTELPGTLSKILIYSLRMVPRWAKIKIMQKVMGGMTSHQRK